MRTNKVYLVACLLLISTSIAAEDCDALFDVLSVESIDLDYHAFDQTQGSGFRALAERGCPRRAADLIEIYIEATGATQKSLIWHLAQMRGEAGQTEAALIAAQRSLNSNETSEAPFRWNAHVRAYIAFLENDPVALEKNLVELQGAVNLHQGNGINASLWEQLKPYVELGYPEAVRRAYGGSN